MKKKLAIFFMCFFIVYMITRNPRIFIAEIFYTPECYKAVVTKEMKIEGVITKKFIDSANHLNPTITVNKNGKSDKFYFPSSEEHELFDSLKIGDYLIKKRGYLLFSYGNKKNVHNIMIKYNCN